MGRTSRQLKDLNKYVYGPCGGKQQMKYLKTMSKPLKTISKPLRLNAQFFSEQIPPADTQGSVGNQEQNPGDAGTGQTEEDIQKRIESESDRKLEAARQKWQQDQEAKTQDIINKAIEDQKRLSTLSEEEKKNEELTAREEAIAKQEADIAKQVLLIDAKSILKSKDLPDSFAEVLLGKDADSTLTNINDFKATFDEAVNAVVKEKLRQETPPAGGGGLNATPPANTVAQARNNLASQAGKAPDPWATNTN